ncbi:MAG: hypothetical protein ACI80V_000443 [Rhodothermales bacterium]|jgi:hypothetical protein
MKSLLRVPLLLSMVALVLLAGCMSPRATGSTAFEIEGRVTVRGNEPFTAVILETEQGNWYVLELTPEQRTGLVNPSMQRVFGELYRGDWNGRPFATIRVATIQRLER